MLLAVSHLWVSNTADGTVSRVDPVSGEVVATINVGQGPRSLAFDGVNVWVVSTRPTGSLSRIDVGTNELTANVDLIEGLGGIAFDGDLMWVAGFLSGELIAVNPETLESATTGTIGIRFADIAYDGELLWAADAYADELRSFDTTALADVHTVSGLDLPSEIAYFEGSVWTISEGSMVSRIDPTDGRILATIEVGKGAWGMASDGEHLWVANRDDATLSKIDLASNTVLETRMVGKRPTHLAFDGTYLWVTDQWADEVIRVRP